MKWLVPFLIVESDWKATNTPSTPTIYPNTSYPNFEIAVLFKVVERSANYIFEDDSPPTALEVRVVSYALGTYKVFIEILVIET